MCVCVCVCVRGVYPVSSNSCCYSSCHLTHYQQTKSYGILQRSGEEREGEGKGKGE